MGAELGATTILAYAIGLILVLVIARLLVIPVKIMMKLLINTVIGGIVLLVVNFFGAYIGLTIGINPITALIVGFLGIPGVVLLIVLQYML